MNADTRRRIVRAAAVVNPSAGGVRPGDGEALARVAAEHGTALKLVIVDDGACEAAVRHALDFDPELLVVLGGDGTARLAAELAGPEGPLLAPLPGGTLNMLPRSIYGDLDWRAALTGALADGRERAVSGGRADNRAFFVAALFGPPALFGLAREAARRGSWVAARRRFLHAWRRTLSGEVRYAADDRPPSQAEALALITPPASKAAAGQGALETAALDLKGAGELGRLALQGLVGAWREDPAVSLSLAKSGWAAMRGGVPAILDGEAHRLAARVEFAFVPRAFRALAADSDPRPSL